MRFFPHRAALFHYRLKLLKMQSTLWEHRAEQKLDAGFIWTFLKHANLSSSHPKPQSVFKLLFKKKKRRGHWDSGTTTHGTQQINSCSVVYKRKNSLFFLIFFSFYRRLKRDGLLTPEAERRCETRQDHDITRVNSNKLFKNVVKYDAIGT